jgi:hypothetical protein
MTGLAPVEPRQRGQTAAVACYRSLNGIVGQGLRSMGWYQRADYKWLLLADPPVCRPGRPLAALNNCERRRKGEICWCRFSTSEIVDDLAAIGEPNLGDEWLTMDLEARDVEDFRDAVKTAAERLRQRSEATPVDQDTEDALERVSILVRRLNRLVENESGLNDRYADDVDE